jgi:predicted nucleotidyltransferase
MMREMPTVRLPPDLETRLVTLGDTLAAHPSVVFAYLFGSAARGELRPLSDVDVAIFVTETAEPGQAKLDLVDAVARHLRTDAVDVVILNVAPTALVGRILRGRRVIADRDPFRRHRFESAELRKFFDFTIREERLLSRLIGGRSEPHPAQAG